MKPPYNYPSRLQLILPAARPTFIFALALLGLGTNTCYLFYICYLTRSRLDFLDTHRCQVKYQADELCIEKEVAFDGSNEQPVLKIL